VGISRLLILALFLATPVLCSAAASDPSEEMTPAELATIPEPVPAVSAASGISAPPAPSRSPMSAPGGVLWRVQIFSTQDSGLADRIAGEAAQLLGVKAYVARESFQYKVQLGDFGTETEALSLRMKAVRSGYPGAFRIRCASNPTLNND